VVTREELAALTRLAGFADPTAIMALARPMAVLRPIGEIDGGGVDEALAGSWLGGMPLLPPSVAWPTFDGRSLAFIGQIDLGNLPSALVDDGFTADGHLAFFYVAEQNTWGLDLNDAGSFQVIHVPGGAVVGERALPDDLPDGGRFPPTALTATNAVALPPNESALIDALGLTPMQAEAYGGLLEELAAEDAWAARCLLGGHPDQIQGDIMQECARVAEGVRQEGGPAAHQAPETPDLASPARRWRLLLQVPSSDEAGMMWGDVGCLYYCIRDEDLRAGRFDRVWMTAQW
jgi:uncharacterized protein YwqG